MMSRSRNGIIAALLYVIAPVALAQAQPLPQTGAERAGFERSTSHDELLDFLGDVQARTGLMRVGVLTTTNQGRDLPLVLLGTPPAASPGAAWFSGKPLVFITGNVHGTERAGREGTLQLIRELTLGAHRDVLERVNVMIVPTLNPDGHENRARANSLGYDMNRDFIVAETREIGAILERVLTSYWPDVYVDVHNGGAYPYHLTYQATLHPAADAALVAFARGPVYDAVARHLAQDGRRFFWYSGPRQDTASGEWAWRTTEPWARKQHTYGGLHNMITLLYEIPGRWTLAEQADNTREGLVGLLRFVADNAPAVRAVVMEARQRTIETPPAHIVIGTQEAAYPDPAEFFVEQDGEIRLVTGLNRTLWLPASTRARPWAYALDGRHHDVAEFLRRHAIDVERLDAPVDVSAEQYRLDAISWADTPYQNHLNARADVTVVPVTITLPAGTYLVRMAQPAARLVSELFEPDSEDSMLVWNMFDHALSAPRTRTQRQEPHTLPFYRIMASASVRATLVD